MKTHSPWCANTLDPRCDCTLLDESVAEWNRVLATGDQELIDRVRERLLHEIHTRIMNDDPNYVEAGWKILVDEGRKILEDEAAFRRGEGLRSR